MALPVGFHLIAKTEHYVDKKDGKAKRRSPVSKNDLCRGLIQQAVTNQIPFRYVLTDVWFAAAETMRLVKPTLDKDVILPLKRNRKVALSRADQQDDRYVGVETLTIAPGTVREIYVEDVDFPLFLSKHVLMNEDGSSGVWYLVTSDATLGADAMAAIYRTRWTIEVDHKSLKQNASLERSPTRTVTTQTNHFFAALCGYIKLELLKPTTALNHFALKTKLYLHATQVAFAALHALQPVRLAA